MEAESSERAAGTGALRPLTPALAERYGVKPRRRVSTWLIGVAAVLAAGVAIVGEAGAAGVLAALSWALLLAWADRRARRPLVFLLGALLAMLVALLLPLGRHLPEFFADPQWIPFAVIYILFAFGGVIPWIVTPVVTYLWFARTRRIR